MMKWSKSTRRRGQNVRWKLVQIYLTKAQHTSRPKRATKWSKSKRKRGQKRTLNSTSDKNSQKLKWWSGQNLPKEEAKTCDELVQILWWSGRNLPEDEAKTYNENWSKSTWQRHKAGRNVQQSGQNLSKKEIKTYFEQYFWQNSQRLVWWSGQNLPKEEAKTCGELVQIGVKKRSKHAMKSGPNLLDKGGQNVWWSGPNLPEKEAKTYFERHIFPSVIVLTIKLLM